MSLSPRLSFSLIAPQQAQKHVTVNEGLMRIDALLHLSVKSATLAVEPAAPSEGDAYIIPSGAAGATWSGLAAGNVVAFQDGGWLAMTPRDGWRAHVEDESGFRWRDGAVWRAETASAASAPQFGVNTGADTTNRLSTKSDAVRLSHDDVTPGTGDMRLVVNKSAAAKTATVIFQDAASGRAEIGLAGDDNLRIKISSDGASWSDALFIDKATGYVGIASAAPASRLHVRQASDARVTIETVGAGSGGGFDILNSGDGSSWRVTGQSTLFKIRDHAALLDKLTLHAGATGDAYFSNIGNLGVGTAAPVCQLDVNGPAKVKSYSKTALPAAAAGAGQIIYVSDEAGGATIAFSDGAAWRRVADRAVVS